MTPERGRRLLFLLLSAGAVAAIVAANLWKGDLRVGSVEVRGNRIVGAAEILRRAAVPAGARLVEVDLFAARLRVEENAFIRSADVSREVPDRIVITVEERAPAAVLGVDPLLYLDAEGVILPATASPEMVDLPVLTGRLPRRELVPGRQTYHPDLREALGIIAAAARVDDGLAHLLSEIHLRPEGEFVLYTAEGGIPVFFGRGDAPRKLVNLDVFWHAEVDRAGPAALGSVDLRFTDQVVVRWRQDRSPRGRTAADGPPAAPDGQRSPT